MAASLETPNLPCRQRPPYAHGRRLLTRRRRRASRRRSSRNRRACGPAARAARAPTPSAAPGRRACRSPRRDPGPARCWRRCARAARPASGGPGARGNGRQRKFWSSASEPAYGSPWCEVRVRGLQVGGREGRPARAWPTRGSGCAGRAAPGSGRRTARAARSVQRPVARVELAGGVALHVPRQLLQLDPEDPLALRRAARVDRQRLAADDRRLGRQQAALGLVDRARDAVEARRHVDDRRLRRAARRRPSAAARRARSGSASRSARSGSGGRRRRPRRRGLPSRRP